MLDKKHFWAIFLFEIKWAKKQQRQFSTSTVHLAQELLMNVQCSGSSGSFTKETKSLEDDHSGHQKLITTRWKPSLKLILLELHKKLPKNSASTILWSFGIWSILERWKSLISWYLMLLLLSPFSRVWLCATPLKAASQAPPSLGFSRQEYWSRLPFPSPWYLMS